MQRSMYTQAAGGLTELSKRYVLSSLLRSSLSYIPTANDIAIMKTISFLVATAS